MKMTSVERLHTVMLAEIMEALQLNKEIDPSFIKKMVFARHEWAITWQYGSGAFGDEEPVSDQVVSETASILSMMSYIEFSVSQLPSEQQEALKNEPLKFVGFDGNHDEHFGVATTMIEDLGRWSEFSGRYMNSHGAATAASYLRLKPAFDDAMQGNHARGLTFEQLQTIAGAARF